MRVLLTGATSFLGAHLARHLLQAGFEVAATFRTPHARLDELASLGGDLRFFRLDLADESSFAALPRSIDAALHVAGISQTNGTADDILACNVAGARNLQRYALEAGAAKAIYTSTLSIHGRIVEPVVTENTVSVEPDLYGASKLLAERLFAATADRLPAVAIRLPGVLGPGAHRAWIPTTLEKIRQGREIAIYNPEGQFNNAAHVDDLGAFVAGLLRDDWSGFHAFPVGAKGAITIAGVIERLSAGMPQPAMRIMQEARNSFLISSEYATGMFGYRPMEIGAMLDKYVSESLAEPISTRKTQTGLRRQG